MIRGAATAIPPKAFTSGTTKVATTGVGKIMKVIETVGTVNVAITTPGKIVIVIVGIGIVNVATTAVGETAIKLTGSGIMKLAVTGAGNCVWLKATTGIVNVATTAAGKITIKTALSNEAYEPTGLPGATSPDRNFVDAILGRDQVQVPPVCGLRVIELTEAAWKSAETGGPVKVESSK